MSLYTIFSLLFLAMTPVRLPIVEGETTARGVAQVVPETSIQEIVFPESHGARTQEGPLEGKFRVPIIEVTQLEVPV